MRNPKLLKAQRQRRAWNRHGNVKSAITINRAVLNEYTERAKGLVDQVTLPDHFQIELWRRSVMQRIAKLEAQEMTLSFWGPGPKNCYQESQVFFNPEKTKWVVIHRDHKNHIERESIVYSSKEVLVIRWNSNKICWTECRQQRVPAS